MEEPGFAERLKLRRAAAGLSQRELARASALTQPLIAGIESGSRQPSKPYGPALDAAMAVRTSRLLRTARERVLAAVQAAGGHDVRVFGSVARD